jgi:hypothetical protein
MALWAISGAPLLVGADLTKLSPATLSTLIDPEVLAIDQDELGLQAVKIAEPAKGLQVWAKPLSRDGARAILLLNRNTDAAEITVTWKDLGLVETAPASVKDIGAGKKLGSFTKSYSAHVLASDAVFLVVKGTDAPARVYHADFNRTPAPGADCSGFEMSFSHVASSAAWTRINIRYTNAGKTLRFADLQVNGQTPTQMAFPPTGAIPGQVSVMIHPDEPGTDNTLRLSGETGPSPAIESVAVQ